MIPSFDTMKTYVIVGAVLAAGIGGAAGAWKVQDWRYKAAETERKEHEQETQRLRARVADKASESHEQAKVQIKTEFQTIYRDVEHVIEKPIYRNVCFDDDGMRQLSLAIGTQPAASEPTPAVRSPDPAK
jgi:hypothetical protein